MDVVQHRLLLKTFRRCFARDFDRRFCARVQYYTASDWLNYTELADNIGGYSSWRLGTL
jgi:hypothetical protein